LLSLAGPRFSSGSGVRLSQHVIRGIGRHNLARILISRYASSASGTKQRRRDYADSSAIE
jgi:hypothetical protein